MITKTAMPRWRKEIAWLAQNRPEEYKRLKNEIIIPGNYYERTVNGLKERARNIADRYGIDITDFGNTDIGDTRKQIAESGSELLQKFRDIHPRLDSLFPSTSKNIDRFGRIATFDPMAYIGYGYTRLAADRPHVHIARNVGSAFQYTNSPVRHVLSRLTRSGRKDMPLLHNIVLNHEVDEAVAALKAREAFSRNRQKYVNRFIARARQHGYSEEDIQKYIKEHNPNARFNKYTNISALNPDSGTLSSGIPGSRKIPFAIKGTHENVDVIGKERMLLDHIANQDSPDVRAMRTAREGTGETRFLDTYGKHSGKFGFNKKNIRNLHSNNAMVPNANDPNSYKNTYQHLLRNRDMMVYTPKQYKNSPFPVPGKK